MTDALAVARHLKRAQRLVRDATREAAKAADVDTVAHVVLRRDGDLGDLVALLRVALHEHGELDVVVFSADPRRNGR